jgi:subtilisin family serine protease
MQRRGILNCERAWTDKWFRKLGQAQSLLSISRRTPLSDKDQKKRVKIAILDTGIDITHPLFEGYEAAGQFPDVFDFVKNCKDITDESGHGPSAT